MDIKIGGKYQHYKGNFYQVLTLARHSENHETLVIYRALYGDETVWARPAHMWNETVDVKGKPVARFTLIAE